MGLHWMDLVLGGLTLGELLIDMILLTSRALLSEVRARRFSLELRAIPRRSSWVRRHR